MFILQDKLLTKQLVMAFILRVWHRNAKRNTKLFHNNTTKYMAQRFKELNKNAICLDKNKKSSLFFS